MAPFGLLSPKCRADAACSSHSDCFPWLPRLQSWLQLPACTENPCASSFCSGFSNEFQTHVPNCFLYTSIYMSLRNLRFSLFLTAFISFQPDFSSWTLCEYCHCPGSQPLFTTSSQSSTVQRWGGGGGYEKEKRKEKKKNVEWKGFGSKLKIGVRQWEKSGMTPKCLP